MSETITLEYFTHTRKYFISTIEVVNGIAVTTPVEDAGYEYYKALRLFNKILRGDD